MKPYQQILDVDIIHSSALFNHNSNNTAHHKCIYVFVSALCYSLFVLLLFLPHLKSSSFAIVVCCVLVWVDYFILPSFLPLLPFPILFHLYSSLCNALLLLSMHKILGAVSFDSIVGLYMLLPLFKFGQCLAQ